MAVRAWYVACALWISTTCAAIEVNYDGASHVRLTAGHNLQGKKSIAIIGAGIGGASTAYFLRQLLSDEVDITVYDRNDYVGGRVTEIEVGGKRFELGGAVVHSSNEHMVNLTRDVGLHLSEKGDLGSVGIWDGEQFVFTWSSILDGLWAMWRYGWAPVSTRSLVSDTVYKFVRIYDLQVNQRTHFATPDELLQALELYNLTQESGYSFFDRMGINDLYVREFVDPVARINYGQSSALNAFVDLVSLAGASMTGSCHSIKGGNARVVSKALERARANVKLSATVESVRVAANACEADAECPFNAPADRPVYEIHTLDGQVDQYDAVVLAAPLELANVRLSGIELPDNAKVPRQYQVTHVTFVVGELNATYFRYGKASSLPSTVATMEKDTIPWSSVSPVGSTVAGQTVYKMFSRTKPTPELLDAVFAVRAQTHHHEWRAYPVLTPVKNAHSPPFRLDQGGAGHGLFYVNAMETAVSCMETEAIGAKNVALALCASLQGSAKCEKH